MQMQPPAAAICPQLVLSFWSFCLFGYGDQQCLFGGLVSPLLAVLLKLTTQIAVVDGRPLTNLARNTGTQR